MIELSYMAKNTTLKEVGEMLGYVVEHMATKEDVARLATKEDLARLGEQVGSIERELKSIHRELDELREAVENLTGYRKEIDHALERIAEIERHLGLEKKIAA